MMCIKKHNQGSRDEIKTNTMSVLMWAWSRSCWGPSCIWKLFSMYEVLPSAPCFSFDLHTKDVSNNVLISGMCLSTREYGM